MATLTKLPKKIDSVKPPVITDTMLSGRYAVFADKWYPVSPDFTLEEAMKHWNKVDKIEDTTIADDWTWQVENSKKNGYYTVKFDKAGWSCTCAGFGYRRDCRHVQETKKK